MRPYWKKGPKRKRAQPNYLREKAEGTDPEKMAMMLTTSGTTAKPKLSMLSHENLIFASNSFGQVVKMEKGDELLSSAPLSWIGEQTYNVVRFLTLGPHYNFPEETETLRRDLWSSSHFISAGPRPFGNSSYPPFKPPWIMPILSNALVTTWP